MPFEPLEGTRHTGLQSGKGSLPPCVFGQRTIVPTSGAKGEGKLVAGISTRPLPIPVSKRTYTWRMAHPSQGTS